jgi:hypothetical protein
VSILDADSEIFQTLIVSKLRVVQKKARREREGEKS